MSVNKQPIRHAIAAAYIRDNFEATDLLAVVLINRHTNSVIQRLAKTAQIVTPRFIAWLGRENDRCSDVYISMNALREQATGRTKADVHRIRHVYLDLDEQGDSAMNAIFKRKDVPVPSYVLNTSPDKWQVVWKVDGFAKEHAEALQRTLPRDCGGDPAATDCARVLRVPGFYNHKYAEPYVVRSHPYNGRSYTLYGPEDFKAFVPSINAHRDSRDTVVNHAGRPRSGTLSQSERDWAYAKRALARGEPEHCVIAAIAIFRRFEKHNPQQYAERTVKKAAQALATEPSRSAVPDPSPER